MLDNHEWAVVRSGGDLGKFLSRLRVKRGWTQEGLARRLGIPRRYLHELESGKDVLAYTRLFRLLRLLGAELTLTALADPSEEPDPWQV
ncbi:MAG: helix-turn-helix domain-containing protein [Bifidobacteriaceae bacterium]|jgi:HTH-type transcriptional regulator/antitoxin HipB|nr:helix-turn-helix domain-containing protein [Bifidobacteriaceae bacterium]